ncbi:DUF4880 domain-containing protein [Bradyrhizobium sp. CSA112]|uniref:FecR family protein n=1 Tax=Bradyrhizobium sp. CSA112 TaxID=2699170 RepID=UPI0023AFFA77|nr:FecR domain-containing protein [Bradyrhizobium sp. CSA112]MDE5458293.1 DUF4880 domain-containing protein [Bradyrhizobium sp. CSA112]
MSKARRQGPDLDPLAEEAIGWVQKLAPGEATPADKEASRHWRALSPAHEAAFLEAKRIWSKAGAAGKALHPDVDVLAELDALANMRRTATRRAVLGGGVAALAAATVYGATRPPFGLWPSLSELNADYRTRTGEQRALTFAGDVAISLNTQTSLAIRPPEGAEDRVELIAGEASFERRARAARSLAVLAAGGQAVTEFGRFDVRYTTTAERAPVGVTCFEGLVRIEHGSDRAALRPGQRVHYGATGLSPIVTIDPVAASDWQRGVVEFHGTALTEAVEEINRYRPGRIILMNAALAQKRLSGRFRIDQMDQVLLQLEHAFSAKLQRLPGGVVLLS